MAISSTENELKRESRPGSFHFLVQSSLCWLNSTASSPLRKAEMAKDRLRLTLHLLANLSQQYFLPSNSSNSPQIHSIWAGQDCILTPESVTVAVLAWGWVMWVGSAPSEPRDRERGRDTRVALKEERRMDGRQVATNRFSTVWIKGNANSSLSVS